MNMQKYYGQLVGAKIIGFKFEKDESFGWTEEWPVFTLQIGKEKVNLTISQDEEGNGAGFAFIELAQ